MFFLQFGAVRKIPFTLNGKKVRMPVSAFPNTRMNNEFQKLSAWKY